ncbi:MAG: alpha/beta hydrolase [Actinobacteria bacterium]|nr:alpha/beta hydrolase [Actinomycetota bacterium]
MSIAFAEFESLQLDVGPVQIHVRTAGSGPPLLLLHGYPESSLMWRDVASSLAEKFTVVATDLRGYGNSSTPPDDELHETYSKRAMAADQAKVMELLGHDKFMVAGHDRGGRVAHRLALDFPTRINRLAVLDIIPTLHMFENVDREMAQSYFHWFFLIQGNGVPEQLINADPQAWIASRFSGRLLGENPIDPDAITEYTNIFQDPAHVAATCADYRAAASIDLDHDRADRSAKHRITAPLLVMWGQSSYVGRNFDSVEVWKNFADQVTGIQAPSDHYIPEEAPSFTAEVLSEFFSAGFNK